MPFWRAFLILLATTASAPALGEQAEGARTERARSPMDTPGGGWAHGFAGDYVLRSDSVHAVIGGFPTDADADTVAPFRFGALLDIVPSLRHTDGLGYLMPTVAHSLGQVELGDPSIQFSSGTDGVASITVSRVAIDHAVTFTTDYRLAPDAPGFLIESRHGGDAPADWSVEDRVAWGEYRIFVPGVGFGMPDGAMVQGAEFLLGERDADTLLLIPETGTLSVRRDGALTSVRYDGAGGGEPVRRWLLIGEDAADLLSWFMESRREAQLVRFSGIMRERATDAASGASWSRGASLAPMILAIPQANGAARPFLPFRTKTNGTFAATVPPGEYLLMPGHSRLGAEPASMRLELSAGAAAKDLEFNVAAHPTVSINVVDAETSRPIAARIVLTGVLGTATPRLGRAGTTRMGGTVISASGREVVSLPPGEYDMRVSSGIEYHPDTQRVTIVQGEPAALEVSLQRAFRTDGWLAGDMASRTDADPFSSATLQARTASAKAEGLDWLAPGNLAPVGEIVDFPILGSNLRATPPIGELPLLWIPAGDCHLKIWMPAEQELETLMENAGDKRLVGRLSQSGVTGLAVMDSSLPEAFGSRFQSLQALRDAGMPLLPFGISNATSVVGEELGNPRVFARADCVEDVPAALMAGRYQVTNGAFFDLRINGEQVDGPVVTRNGILDFDMRVLAIDEVSVARLTVLVNGRLARQLFFNESLREAQSGVAVPVPADADAGKFRITVDGDCVIDLVIEGEDERPNPLISPRGSPFAQTNAARGTLSRAFHAPIHVKIDRGEDHAP